MGREWPTVAGALMAAVLSAGGLGAGLLSITPVLGTILDPNTSGGLRRMAQELRDESPWVAMVLDDGLIGRLPTDAFDSVLLVIGGLAVLTVLGGVMNFLHVYLAETAVQRTVARIRRHLFASVIRMPLATVLAGSADMISRIVNDPAQLGAGLRVLLSKTVAQVTKGVAAMAVAFVLNWPLALASCVLAPIIYTIIRKLGKAIRRASRSALESQSLIYGMTTEALQGLRVVKASTAERYESGRFRKLNERQLRDLMRARTARALSSPVAEVTAILIVAGLSLIAIKAVLDDVIKPEVFILTLGSLAAAGASLRPLAGLVADIQQSSASADRIEHLLAAAAEPGHGRGLVRLPRHAQDIRFEGVTFTYAGAAAPALDGITLRIAFGETVAFVGPNGSGKTTLLALIPRLFDPDAGAGVDGGRVLLDGVDLRGVSVRSLRGQIGVVTQEAVLFEGTIRDNIAYGAGAVSDAAIERAARRARAWDFIQALPGGLDARVGERGTTLSGGQRQRLAIARAILREPAILILDEATSMIDAESEARIAEAIEEFGRGRTVLVVAHRLSTVVKADRIVVMNSGRIEDVGTHRELLARCPLYADLARHQLIAAPEASPAPTATGRA